VITSYPFSSISFFPKSAIYSLRFLFDDYIAILQTTYGDVRPDNQMPSTKTPRTGVAFQATIAPGALDAVSGLLAG
jgi:hypothetical protein